MAELTTLPLSRQALRRAVLEEGEAAGFFSADAEPLRPHRLDCALLMIENKGRGGRHK